MKPERTTAVKRLRKLNQRTKIVRGGSSAGKTIAILCILIDYALRHENKEISVEIADEQLLNLFFVSSRYFKERFTPPFRVGRKQGRVVLDAKGLEVAHFYFSDENMADDYVKWLNGC